MLTVKLESQQISQRVDRLTLSREAFDQEIVKSNKLLADSQAKVAGFLRLIEQKQSTIVSYRKRISQIAASTGVRACGRPCFVLRS